MEDVHVEVTTTDGHLGIAAHMRSKYSDVIHNQVTIALCVNRATVLEYRYVATKNLLQLGISLHGTLWYYSNISSLKRHLQNILIILFMDV